MTDAQRLLMLTLMDVREQSEETARRIRAGVEAGERELRDLRLADMIESLTRLSCDLAAWGVD